MLRRLEQGALVPRRGAAEQVGADLDIPRATHAPAGAAGEQEAGPLAIPEWPLHEIGSGVLVGGGLPRFDTIPDVLVPMRRSGTCCTMSWSEGFGRDTRLPVSGSFT